MGFGAGKVMFRESEVGQTTETFSYLLNEPLPQGLLLSNTAIVDLLIII